MEIYLENRNLKNKFAKDQTYIGINYNNNSKLATMKKLIEEIQKVDHVLEESKN